MMTFAFPRHPQKILAYTNELCTKVQKFWQKDGFFVDKKETSDHLCKDITMLQNNTAFR